MLVISHAGEEAIPVYLNHRRQLQLKMNKSDKTGICEACLGGDTQRMPGHIGIEIQPMQWSGLANSPCSPHAYLAGKASLPPKACQSDKAAPESTMMIENLQLLRGLAALAVVFFHTDKRFFGDVHTEFGGVSVFFVISGFIMAYIVKNGPFVFLYNRFTRIFPLYAILTLMFVLITQYGFTNLPYTIPTLIGLGWDHGPTFLNNQFAATMTPERVSIIVKSLLFVPVPSNLGPVIGVGWSLNLEMLYYGVFALCLLFSQKWSPLICMLMLVGMFVAGFYTDVSNKGGYGHINFASGILIYYVSSFLTAKFLKTHKLNLVLLSIATILTYVLFYVDYFIGFVFRVCFLPAMLVLCLILLNNVDLKIRKGLLTYLGEISYSLYLVHLLVLDLMRPFGVTYPLLNFSTSWLGCLIAMSLSLLLAICVHHTIERPVTKWVRKHGILMCNEPNCIRLDHSMLERRKRFYDFVSKFRRRVPML